MELVRKPPTGIALPSERTIDRIHAGQTVKVAVSDTTLAIDLGDGDTRVVSRTTTLPVRNVKAFRDRAAAAE